MHAASRIPAGSTFKRHPALGADLFRMLKGDL